ncbi:MAG: FHA domain-containing protein [Clostridia bacterium]|nr:FHA domain-containing protein [Clostridia bacterium]
MFEKELCNDNMLVYKTEPFETVDDFTCLMLKANPLPEIIPIGMEEGKILIPISNLIPLRDYLESFEEDYNLLNAGFFIRQYNEILEKADNYMIPREEVIFNFEYAFVNADEGALVLPVVPTSHSYFETHTLFEFESCIVNVIKSISNAGNKPREEPVFKEKKKKKEKKPKKERKRINKIKETLFSGNGDDVFEFEADTLRPDGVYVVAVRSTGAEYPLLFGPDIIGTDESRCSIPFAGNREMEAAHASITLAKGKYYLADLNSKSGTLLNGEPVEPGKTYELCSADLISIAGEELVFSRRS